MGQLAKKICGKVGCNVLTAEKYCTDHNGVPQFARKEFDKIRQENPIRQLYFTPQWRATRNVITARDPVCKLCRIFPSTIADHMVPAKEYLRGLDPESDEAIIRFCDESNLQGVCKACHNSKTARETNKFKAQ